MNTLASLLIAASFLIEGTFNVEVTPTAAQSTPTPTPAPVAGDIDLTGYTLVFEENFDAVSVATTDVKGDATWFFWPPYGPAGSFSFSHWSADSTTLKSENGVLLNTAWWDASINDAGERNWRSGCLSSMDKTRAGFGQRYGYFSARIKMPNAGRGAFPAFWLASSAGIPNAGAKGYEIDIMEYWGARPGEIAHTTHPWNADGSQAGPPWEQGGFVSVSDPINTWHIYGCKVAPDYVCFYIDGVETRRTPTNNDYLHDPLYILVDYALGGGYPIDGDPFASHGPSSLLVDWVRAYSLPSSVVIPPVPGVSQANPGFEEDGASVQEVGGWGEWSDTRSNPAGFSKSAGSHSGSWHYAMEGGPYRLYFRQLVSVRQPGLYTLRAWVKSSGGQNMTVMDAKEYGGEGMSVPLPTTDTWTQVEVKDINVTVGACRIGFWSDANAGNWIAVDDVEFVKQ